MALCYIESAAVEQNNAIHQYPIKNEVGKEKWDIQECVGTDNLNWQILELELGNSF